MDVSSALASVLALAIGIVLLNQLRSDGRHLPPGPPSHWLYGTSIPSHSWRKFYEWTKEYGEVITVRTGRMPLVIVGSCEAANEILEKQGALTADRPRSIAVGEVLGGGMRLLTLREGEKFKRMRRALHAHLQPKVAAEYEDLQFRAARNVILDILKKPSQFQAHASRYAASVIISITYGKQRTSESNDPVVLAIRKCLGRITASLVPGKYAIESYPFLRYVPGYLDELRQWHREELQLFKSQYRSVAKQVSSGDAPPSITKYMIKRQDELGLSEDEAAYVCGGLFGAGSDTTAAAIAVLIMAAACFPKVQRKAQEQLDIVVGRERMPTFADSDDLPYVHAFVLESYRWRPVSSGGFQHRATMDIVFKDYVIPKGTSVMGNHWAILRDPAVFPDSESFRPERWLNNQGNLRNDLKNCNFGFGRRTCPGIHVANRSLFINAALLLWSFSISEDPKSPIDTLAFTSTANSHPLPFEAQFKRRFEGVEEIVTSTSVEEY